VTIVLDKQGVFTSLREADGHLATRDDGSRMTLRWHNGELAAAVVASGGDTSSATMFVDASRDSAGRILTVPVPNYGPRITAQRLKLGATRAGNGFIRKTLGPLPTIERQLKEAPAEGYGEAIFPQDELERLLLSREERSWFFVRLEDRYGRGCIEELEIRQQGGENGQPGITVGLHMRLWMQLDGSRNLETRP
jgi:hypothetical protein